MRVADPGGVVVLVILVLMLVAVVIEYKNGKIE